MKTSFALISDTHGYRVTVPEADVLLHAGDGTRMGTHAQVEDLAEWLGALPHEHKVFVPGNHDFACQQVTGWARDTFARQGVTMLVHEPLVVRGIRLFGSPWQPWFYDWAFNVRSEEERRRLWSQIPEDTQVLVTHSPPYGVLDRCDDGRLVGCHALRERVDALPSLRLHLFGHIHESYGTLVRDGRTFVNAACCTLAYQPTQLAIVLDLET